MATEVSDVSKPFMSGIKSMETTHKPLLVLRCKVVVVGDSTVGKSALVQMFHSGGSTYPRNYVMTTWVDFSVSAPPRDTPRARALSGRVRACPHESPPMNPLARARALG